VEALTSDDGLPESLDGMDGIRGGWIESGRKAKQSVGNQPKTWNTRLGRRVTNLYVSRCLGFPPFHEAMCKLAKLSFVAGAELPKRYLLM
jgi:hypothetical protein